MGDINGHHPAWGSPTANKRGDTIARAAEERNLILLNDGSHTFTRGTCSSAIDVTMASPSLVPHLLWRTDDDTCGSDHYPIIISLNQLPPTTSRRPRWLYKTANWEEYQTSIASSIASQPCLSLDDMRDRIFEKASSCIERSSSRAGRRATHWWSPEIKAEVKARRKALRILRKTTTDHPDFLSRDENYRALRNRCRKSIAAAKNASFQEFIDQIKPSTPADELWRRVNALNGKRRGQGFALKIGTITTRDPGTIAEELGSYFASLSAYEPYPAPFKNANSSNALANFTIPPDNNNNLINTTFSMREMQHALSRGQGKSDGPDKIGYPLLKNLPTSGKEELLELYNSNFLSETIPEEWRRSLVVPIRKKAENTGQAEDYRPIALTSCLSKIFERMINRRLQQAIDQGNLLDHRQHAFRPGKGTGSYFAALREILPKEDGKHCELATLDLSKAYNRAWTPTVLNQLVKWGITGHTLAFIKNFLVNRTFRVIIGNHTSKEFSEETGVPQGSVLAVTLFLIAVNSIFVALPKRTHTLLYADDILLLATGPRPRILRRKLQAAVRAVAKWANSVGFRVAPDKSRTYHVCASSHHAKYEPITIEETPIPRGTPIRILGVTLDRKLTFATHAQEVKKACSSRINLVRCIAGKHPNTNRTTRARIANAILFSKLSYGIELTSMGEQIENRLAPIYNKAIRITSGLLPNTPADIACAEGGFLPFRHKWNLTLCNRAIRHTEKTASTYTDSLIQAAKSVALAFTGKNLPTAAKRHWNGSNPFHLAPPRVDKFFKNTTKARQHSLDLLPNFRQRINDEYSHHTIRYTDGSKAANLVGFGITGSNPPISKAHRLPDETSVFSAEIAAIFVAATTPAPNPIVIFTDSASAIDAINSTQSTHPWVQATIRYAPQDTTFAWIPGHAGIQGNEEADRLANTGRNKTLYHNTVPAADIITALKTAFRNSWERTWAAQDSPLHRIKGNTLAERDPPRNQDQIVLSRLRTGFSKLTYNFGGHPFRILCPICNERNTAEHVLINCPQYEDLRRSLNIGNSIRNALGFNEAAEKRTITFLKRSKLYWKI